MPLALRSAWETRSRNIIAPGEALAILWVKLGLADVLLGRRVLYFVDNESVRIALIAGQTSSKDVQAILRELTALEAVKPT